MKITKSQLKKMIKEALEEPQAKAEPRVTGDVARAGKKLGAVSGIEGILASINTRAEFEQLLMKFIQLVAKEKLKPEDVKIGVRRVAAQILKGP
jgi:adenylyl- and sulfurtransferase ThiI